jgi:hypothetical protein
MFSFGICVDVGMLHSFRSVNMVSDSSGTNIAFFGVVNCIAFCHYFFLFSALNLIGQMVKFDHLKTLGEPTILRSVSGVKSSGLYLSFLKVHIRTSNLRNFIWSVQKEFAPLFRHRRRGQRGNVRTTLRSNILDALKKLDISKEVSALFFISPEKDSGITEKLL